MKNGELMKSKERVIRALTFNKPDHIPIFKAPFNDVFPLANLPPKSWQPNEQDLYPHLITPLIRNLRLYRWKRPAWAPKDWWNYKREEIDQWGCFWTHGGKNDLTMGHPGRPAIDTWDQLETWEGPDTADKNVYKLLNRLSKLFFRKYKVAIIHDIIFINNRVSMLRGFNNFLMDHHKNPNQLHQLIAKVTDLFLRNVEMLLELKPDGIWACDDLGTQQAPFLSAELFKKFYAAPYKKIINYIHDHDCTFHLHSCGNIGALIPTLLDIGVDAFEFDSPRLTGFEELVKFRGKIPFWACVNIQSVYPRGTPEEVEQEVKAMIQTFSTQEGGFLAYFYPDTHVLNVPKQNIKAFQRSLKKWGRYPLTWLS
jgi:hypothetical protein